MKFCEICDNMLYMDIKYNTDANTEKLHMFCKNCNFSKEENPTEGVSICISEKNFSNDASNFKNYITPFIKFDKTIPRMNNIKCPKCVPKNGVNEIAYVKYDSAAIKFLYFCCNCEHFWKN